MLSCSIEIHPQGVFAMVQWDKLVTEREAIAFRSAVGCKGFAGRVATTIEGDVGNPVRPGHKKYVGDFVTGNIDKLKTALERGVEAANQIAEAA